MYWLSCFVIRLAGILMNSVVARERTSSGSTMSVLRCQITALCKLSHVTEISNLAVWQAVVWATTSMVSLNSPFQFWYHVLRREFYCSWGKIKWTYLETPADLSPLEYIVLCQYPSGVWGWREQWCWWWRAEREGKFGNSLLHDV
jgi:hypothetical protein